MTAVTAFLMNIPALVGVGLALSAVILANASGFERRTFYTVIALIVASYYVLFAAMSGEMHVLTGESVIALIFVVLAMFGFKRNMVLVAVALALHGLQDAMHGTLITNAGTPAWWPSFCLSFDITAAAALAWQIRRAQVGRLAKSAL